MMYAWVKVQARASKLLYTCLLAGCFLVLVQIPGWVDAYFREVVNTTIGLLVEKRKDEIDAQIKKNIEKALSDESTQEQVQNLLRKAVADELEQNGEAHLRRIIEQRAPHAIPLLFPPTTKD